MIHGEHNSNADCEKGERHIIVIIFASKHSLQDADIYKYRAVASICSAWEGANTMRRPAHSSNGERELHILVLLAPWTMICVCASPATVNG